MKSLRIVILSVAVTLLAALAFFTAPAHGAPAQQGNLLQNPSFENGTYLVNNDPDWHYVPVNWTPWYNTGSGGCNGNPPSNWSKPHYEVESDPHHVVDGTYSGRYWVSYNVMQAGLYQTVSATAGSTYQFSIQAFGWSSKSGQPLTTSDAQMDFKVGIDPNGGTNANDAAVVWSSIVTSADKFVPLSVTAVANGGAVTVFTYARAYWCLTRNDSFWDAASLVQTASGPAPAAGPVVQPTQSWIGVPAGSIITATPQPDGSIVHTVHSGETCTGIAVTYGVSIDDILKLNNLSSCKILSVGQKLIIKPAGSAAPAATAAATDATSGTQAATDSATSAATDVPTDQVAANPNSVICVMVYEDKNQNGLPEPTDPKVPGVTVTVNSGASPVANYTTDGVSEPHCFDKLPPGSYTVNWSASGFQPVGDQNWSVTTTAGQTVSHQFGVVTSGTSPNSGQGTSSGGGLIPGTEGDGGWPVWATALLGAVGVILLLGGMGVAGYFLLLRRTKI